MTRNDADFIGAMNECDEISNEAYCKIMCHCEIEEKGKWLPVKNHTWECSNCSSKVYYRTPFCAMCGKEMEGFA